MSELRGQTALVTGGAVRIGRAIVKALARAGMRVIIHHRQSASAACELVTHLREEGTDAWAIASDLADPASTETLVDRAIELAGSLDVLINNAAVFHKHRWGQITPSALEMEFRINLSAPILLMQTFVQRVGSGVIINLLDRRITGTDPTCVPYELSKKALAAATRSAAVAWAPKIRVNAVAPGAVLPPPGQDDQYLRDQAGFIPLGGPIPPEEVADAVVFLIRARHLTGQILFVDGGQHLLSGEAVR